MVFHWSLSDRKSPQLSRTLLSILAVLNTAVVWMVSNRPPTFKSSSPFNNPSLTLSKAPIRIGTIDTFMFHSFFNSLARSRYLYYYYYYYYYYYCCCCCCCYSVMSVFLCQKMSSSKFYDFVYIISLYFKISLYSITTES